MNYELYHHGVKGMKWGVRRTPQQLGHKVKKLDSKNERLSKKIGVDKTMRAEKYKAKFAKYNSKAARAARKADDQRNRSDKYGRYSERLERKADRQDSKGRDSSKTRSKSEQYKNWSEQASAKSDKYTDKAKQYAQKRNSYNLKVNDIEKNQQAIKQKIERNRKLQSMYNSTIRDLNAGTIKQGRLFMQYTYDY